MFLSASTHSCHILSSVDATKVARSLGSRTDNEHTRMDASRKLAGEEIEGMKNEGLLESASMPGPPPPTRWATASEPVPATDSGECAPIEPYTAHMPEPVPAPVPIVVAAPAASHHTDEWPKLEEFRQTHPLVRGVGLVVAAPIVVAGAIIVAFGTALYGAGEILVGLGDVVTGGPLKKHVARKVSSGIRKWRSRPAA